MKTLGDIVWNPVMKIIVNVVCKDIDDFTSFMQEWEMGIITHLAEKYQGTVVKISEDDIHYIHANLADYVYKKRKVNLIDSLPEDLKTAGAIKSFDAEARAFENSKPDVTHIIQSITQH